MRATHTQRRSAAWAMVLVACWALATAPSASQPAAVGSFDLQRHAAASSVPLRIDVDLLPLVRLADALDNGVVLAVRREVLLVPREALDGAAQEPGERRASARREREARRLARAWRWRDAAFAPARWWAASVLEPGAVRIEDRLSLRYSTLARSYELRLERLDGRVNLAAAGTTPADVHGRSPRHAAPGHASGADGPGAGRRSDAETPGGGRQGPVTLRRAMFNDLVAALTEGERWLRDVAAGHGHVVFAARIRFDGQALPLPLQWSDAVMSLPPLDGRRGETWQILLP